MTTKFYLDGKKATKKAVTEMLGKEKLDRLLKQSKETYREDPYIENSYFLGRQMLTICFE